MTSTDDQPEGAQRRIWNDLVGDAWVEHEEAHDRQAAPYGDAVLDAVGPLAGASVLDVGCGTGPTSTAAAERGARRVLGIDISETMLAAATRSRSSDTLRFEFADATTFDAPEPFDRVISRFGVMFFEDPVAAFANLRRLTAADGRLAFCAWSTPAENPWMSIPVGATIPILGPPSVPGPGEPGPFSLAELDRVNEVLEGAGWREVEITPLTMEFANPAGGADRAALVVSAFNPLIAGALARQPDRADAARAAIADALRPYERDGVVHLQQTANIITARP